MEIGREDLRTWLKSATERTGLTPTALARRAGLAQSTLTRFLNSDDAPSLSLRSIAKIAHAAGVEPPFGSTQPPAPHGGFATPDATPYSIDTKDPFDQAISAIIAGRSATDPWLLRTPAIEDAGYIPGDIVFVDLNGVPQAGNIVCAQSYRWQEGRAETVFRVFEPPYLVAASNDPTLRRPLLVDNDRVIIKGVVIGMLRRSN